MSNRNSKLSQITKPTLSSVTNIRTGKKTNFNSSPEDQKKGKELLADLKKEARTGSDSGTTGKGATSGINGKGSAPGSASGSAPGSAPGSASGSGSSAPSVSASSSAPPSVGTDSDTIKVEFQALYDNAYTEIKQCFCQGMANLFYEAFLPSTEHVYEALSKALYVDVVNKDNGGIASQVNPDYEIIVGDQIEKIMKFIMTNPDPQIKIDIRKNLSGGCNISQEHHQAIITRGKPTAILGGSSTYKHLKKHHQNHTQKKSYKKSI
jgi:hypothetical protein